MIEQETKASWYAKRGNKEVGPVALGKLQELASLGRLKGSDQVRQASQTEWKLASSVLEFSDHQVRKPVRPVPHPITSEVPYVQFKAEPFLNWYKARLLFSLRWYYQFPIWLICGFVWIPIWYVLSATPSGGARARWGSLSLSGKAVAFLPLLIIPLLVNGSTKQTSREPNGETLGNLALVNDQDFADTNYSFEFDESEYGKVPVGANELVLKEEDAQRSDSDNYMRGTWIETSGYRSSDKQFVSHGVQRCWDDERKGHLLVERQFLHGVLHGKISKWNTTGECIGNGMYVNGDFHGRQWTKFDDGTETESFWLHGNRHGSKRETWPDGKLFSEEFFVDGVQRSPHSQFLKNGNSWRRQFYDEDGKLHGTQLIWGSESHPEPHNIPYEHWIVHGKKILRGRKGEVILQAVYEHGEVKTPMHPAGKSLGSDMLWDLLHFADTAKWLNNPELAKKPKAPISLESLKELFGPPELEEDILHGRFSVRCHRCSDGMLFFVVTPANQMLALDLLTSDRLAQILSDPSCDELPNSDLFKMALGSVLTTDRFAAEVTRRAKNE